MNLITISASELQDDPIDSLLTTTNQLLRDVNIKYQRTQNDLSFLQNFTEQFFNQNLEEKLNTKLLNLQLKHENLIKSLKSNQDKSIDEIKQGLDSLEMKIEDFQIIRKTSDSRLAVYEARLDTLEQMVFEISEKMKTDTGGSMKSDLGHLSLLETTTSSNYLQGDF